MVDCLAQAELPGGEGSVAYNSVQPFLSPMANIAMADRPEFFAGKALATQPWVKAPASTTARDGLGPHYNARSCLTCHIRGDRGTMPEDPAEPLIAALVKVSVPGLHKSLGTRPDPVYGDQLQTRTTSLQHKFNPSSPAVTAGDRSVPAEAKVTLHWQSSTFTYPDGRGVELRKPRLAFSNWGYGDPSKKLVHSLRNAPILYGAGLLEAVPEQDIRAWADPLDQDGDGISGRVNWVWNIATQRLVLGRLGWKANRPDVRHVTAAAFANDIGIRNGLFPDGSCTMLQKNCVQEDFESHPELELSDSLLDLTANFIRGIAVPQGRRLDKIGQRGRHLFAELQCQNCHRPHFTTAPQAALTHLAKQSIWPYTDLLLHDMGADLADDRVEFVAEGREWRTAPLWGMGSNPRVSNGKAYLLHDGRARTLEEAILWHGGEAERAQQAFVQLSKGDRDAVIVFIRAL